jgi:uncharacterized protein YjbJ (UPF0337 family)
MGEILDKIKGKAKQVKGAVTGDRGQQAEGVVDEEKGKLKEKIENAKRALDPDRRDT